MRKFYTTIPRFGLFKQFLLWLCGNRFSFVADGCLVQGYWYRGSQYITRVISIGEQGNE